MSCSLYYDIIILQEKTIVCDEVKLLQPYHMVVLHLN